MLDALERSQKEIKQSRQQLRELADRLEGIREEERTRISRKIDEELGQGLAGLKIDLAWLLEKMPREKEGESEPTVSEKMKALIFRVGKMIQSARHIITDLRPSLLDELGLTAALEWQAKEFERKTGIHCRLDLRIEEKDLPSDLATAVFRIFQRILAHILDHAQATKIDIAFQKINHYLLLEVKDNGGGMEPRRIWNPDSLGMIEIRERALAFRGEIEIEGLPEKGTRIALKIPFPIFSLKI